MCMREKARNRWRFRERGREMKRGGKSGAAEKEEYLGEKLNWVGKRGGAWTPVVPSWRVWFGDAAQDSVVKRPLSVPHPAVSARKLAATLWEFQHYLPLSKMHRVGIGGAGSGGAPPPPPPPLPLTRLRRRHHHHRRRDILADPSPSSPDQPESASSLRRHVVASLMQHHRSIQRNDQALQPVSPASYGSSLEVAPYNPAVTPSSSLDFKGRMGESSYSLKTSAELLKVLNRIWSLEEQHASNISLVKALKLELDHAHARIKELLRDQQEDRCEIDELMKQIAEDKLIRRSKEMDRINAAVQSVRDELEDERKLRKRSESLHRKLARELSEVKFSLSNALKELGREKKSQELLEDLCDEFATGIRDYEQEVHALRQKSDKDWTGKDDFDRLILHISEAWLDERMQMRLGEAQHSTAEKNSTVEKLRFDIETFLHTKRMSTSKNTENLLPMDSKESRNRGNSLESVPLIGTVSAPKDVDDEDNSAGSDLHYFELSKRTNGDFKAFGDEMEGHADEIVKTNQMKKKPVVGEKLKARYPSILQVKFEEQMSRAVACNGIKTPDVDLDPGDTRERNPNEISISQKSQNCEAVEQGSCERKNNQDETHTLKSNDMINNLIRNQILLSEGGNVRSENDSAEASRCQSGWSTNTGHASPVRQWMANLTPPNLDMSETSKFPPAQKENTLKAKLLEARQKMRSRLKTYKGSS